MSDRDELARELSAPGLRQQLFAGDPHDFVPEYAADVLWSAGWRKKPSTEELLACVEHAIDQYLREDLPEDGLTESETVTDAILALLDGPTKTGEK